jgi:hypothetical protein
MKIQGVEILRISDFRRFFEMEDLLVNTKEYADMFKDVDLTIFCDTSREANLVSQIRAWCLGLSLNATFMDNQISLLGDDWIPLGEISKVLDDYRDSISSNNRIGLAYLFLLLKNVWPVEKMRQACKIYQNYKSDIPIGEFVPVYQDYNFKQGRAQTNNIVRKFFMNTRCKEGVRISCGESHVTLAFGDCVVVLFNDNNECIRILPNKSYSEDGQIRMHLKVNTSTSKPYVEIIRPNKKIKIEDVCSFWLEPGSPEDYIVLCKTDGTLVYDKQCYFLGVRHKEYNGQTIIAVESIPHNNDYIFYTR